MAVHYPVAVGKDDSYVLYEKGSKAYKANSGLDTNKDGTVTRGEAVSKAFGKTGGVVIPTPGRTGEVEVSPRPNLRPESTPVSNLAPTESPRPTLRDTERTAEVPQEDSGTPTPSKASPEAQAKAEVAWQKLSNQTKGLLLRLFGNEEGVLEALANGEISEEDLT